MDKAGKKSVRAFAIIVGASAVIAAIIATVMVVQMPDMGVRVHHQIKCLEMPNRTDVRSGCGLRLQFLRTCVSGGITQASTESNAARTAPCSWASDPSELMVSRGVPRSSHCFRIFPVASQSA
jgi:hypothetical protein